MKSSSSNQQEPPLNRVSTDEHTLARRAQIQRWVTAALRAGYGLYAVASTLFFAGYMTGFKPALVVIILICLVVGGICLAPGLVFKYGIKAAWRADHAEAQQLAAQEAKAQQAEGR